MKHKDFNILKKGALEIIKKLNTIDKKYKIIIMGPQKPIISKVKNLFHLNIWIKLGKENLNEVKKIISEKTYEIRKTNDYKQLNILFDVDPA